MLALLQSPLTLSSAFWILMLVYLIYGVWKNYTPGSLNYRRFGGHLLLWLLLFLLGWQVFGFPVWR